MLNYQRVYIMWETLAAINLPWLGMVQKMVVIRLGDGLWQPYGKTPQPGCGTVYGDEINRLRSWLIKVWNFGAYQPTTFLLQCFFRRDEVWMSELPSRSQTWWKSPITWWFSWENPLWMVRFPCRFSEKPMSPSQISDCWLDHVIYSHKKKTHPI